jgi:hypothetical protein
MKRLPSPQRSLGYQLVHWSEHFLAHGPGDVQGQPIELDSEFAGFEVRCYEVDDAGRRVVDEAVLSRPKGRAKSELGGIFVCQEALAPVRFDHWAVPGEESYWGYEYEVGEPVGRPVTYPFIRCLATEEGQSGNTYDNVAFMLAHVAERHGDTFPGIDLGRSAHTSTRIYLPDGGEIVPSTASSAAKDGGKETFTVFDEPHLYVRPELRGMYRVVKRNLAKRKAAEPWALHTTTMYQPGEESVAEVLHRIARDGKTPRLLLDHRGVRRHIEDLDDDELVLAELRYLYGPFAEVMDLGRVLSALRDEADDEAERRRYWLNEEVKGSGKWMAPATWERLARPEVVVADRELITLGLDGSITQDATALVGCTRDAHLFVVGVWERPQGAAGEGWTVPQGEVDAAVAMAFDRWQVLRFYGDPAWYQGWLATWAGRYGDDRVIAWWTNRDTPWARAVSAFTKACIAEPPGLSNDGDSRMARHVANAHKRAVSARDQDGRQMFVLVKDRPNSPRKIDGGVAGVLALEARNDALTAGLFDAPSAPPPATALADATAGKVRVELWRPTKRLDI